MGLDMYLEGNKYFYGLNRQFIDGYPKTEEILQIGYWRKHPDLHGFIVREFQGGVDNCQRTELGKADINKILVAIWEDKLPKTTGFFFGESRIEDKEPSIEIFENALKWLNTPEDDVLKSITYQASW